jgi:hypothetical protein
MTWGLAACSTMFFNNVSPRLFLPHTLDMATAHSVCTAEASRLQSSCDPELLASRGGLAEPDETSPLLRTNHTHRRWHSVRSSVSVFFDDNAGLLLVAASQLFFSGMNISVKWLNSLDEPVPMLEVRV